MRSGTAEAGADVLSGPDIAGRVVRGGALRAIGFGVVNLLGVRAPWSSCGTSEFRTSGATAR